MCTVNKHGRFLKAQSVAEYSILAAAVILALYGMSVYVQRGLQGRFRDAVLVTQHIANNSSQYEPEYLNSGVTQVSNTSIRQKVLWGGTLISNETSSDNTSAGQQILIGQ
jgi:hypothetical protein